MLFNSLDFAVFFAVVLLVYSRLGFRGQNLWLLAASYFFYGSWNWRFLGLLVGSALVDYFVGLRIAASGDNQRKRRAWLAVSITFNLGVLAYFKYLNFFIDSAVSFLTALGFTAHTSTLSIILPAGISFFLFQSMSYAIDLYRRETAVITHLPDYLLYTAFFPNMLAGPIERPSHLSGQLRAPRVVTPEGVSSGLFLMVWGLFKKVAVADNLAPYVDAVYGNASAHSAPTLWLATYVFAFQIYCDFSGYSDMAIGMARVLGIDLIRNFRTPYFARNVQEFWRRWHISLSTWFRDYVYMPLGGSKNGVRRTWINTMAVFLVSGLWHGANWTFVIWGGLHGLYLTAHRALTARATKHDWPAVPPLVGVLLTFNLVSLAWVFFRAGSLDQALTIIIRMFAAPGRLFWDSSLVSGLIALALLLAAELRIEPQFPDTRIAEHRLAVRVAVTVALITSVLFLGAKVGAQFIYFQF